MEKTGKEGMTDLRKEKPSRLAAEGNRKILKQRIHTKGDALGDDEPEGTLKRKEKTEV